MSNAPIAYPFDPSGTLVSNRITAEHQTISPPELSEFHFIIPHATPFFAETMVIVHLPSQRTLVEGVDYVPTHYFQDASLQCARPIYGSITFYDKQLANAVRMAYQTLGGDWTLSPERIIEILSNKLVDPRRVYWEQIAELPYRFPPIDHDWHVDDVIGMDDVVAVLEEIRDALIASGEGGLQAHLADLANPHGTTKDQVGLANVENYPVATIAEAQAGTASNRYLTVLRGAQLVEAIIGSALTNHIGDSNNPHNTTKDQVGLASVDNYATASQVQAEAGSANNLFMTPLRTAQLVAALIGNSLTDHISNTNNPHSTTKAQVGLGNVGNYGIADTVAARLGTANDLYMTPAMTREAIEAIALQGITDHIGDTNNPHGTTKAQVGLSNVLNLGIATQLEAEDATVNTRYMTPIRTGQAIAALVGTAFTAHVNNSANPHGTTKAQVGLANVDNYATATELQAVAGTATNLFMTPATSKALIISMIGESGSEGLATHMADVANPHEVTKTQVGLGSVDNYATATVPEAEAGAANNLFMTPVGSAALIAALVGNALAAHVSSTANPHSTTAAQVGAYPTATVDALLTGKLSTGAQAADSALLQGYSYEQVITNGKTVQFYDGLEMVPGTAWTLLGSVIVPADAYVEPIPDIVGQITGGESPSNESSSSFIVHLTPRNLALSKVVAVNEDYTRDITFGYTVTPVGDGTDTLSLYARGVNNRWPLAAVALSQNNKFFVNTATNVQVEPAGIVYLPVSLPAFTRARTAFGDLSFGELPTLSNNNEVEGQLVEWTSVVDTDGDELIVQLLETSIEQDYGNYLPWSGANDNQRYDDLDVLDQWGWDAVGEGILLDTATVAGNAMLSAQTFSTNYEFEVELSSDNAAAYGAGVIAAHATIDGRPVAITVVRTPGGLTQVVGVPVGVPYKLKTVALHLGQIDAIDLGSDNGALTWSDTDLADDGRDPTTYVAAGNGWDTSGSVKIKVNRTDNVLTIDVSDFGSGTYVGTDQVVIDFEVTPSLAQFVDRPTSWGLISVRQPNVLFKILSYPGLYRDYVRIGVAADNGRQRLYRHNGVSWGFTYLGIANPQVRPNRLYYSAWDNKTYLAQRNGRLRVLAA